MKNKKVVHMTTVHHPLDPRIFYKECLSLKNAGYNVTLIAPASSNLTGEEEIEIKTIKYRSNRLHRLIGGSIEMYKMAKGIKASVYHFHDPELIPIAWMLKKKGNIVIYDIHEDYQTGIVQRDYLILPIRKVLAKVYKIVEKIFTKKMELCLAEKYYKDMYPRGICILNYPLINKTLLRQERKGENIGKELLYTGNMTTDRGAIIHTELLNVDPEVYVYCYGKCSGSLAAEMNRQAGDNKDRLYINGVNRYLPKKEIDKAYVSKGWLAGLALFPPTEHYMKKELTKFFEYMTAGIPILCSDFPKWKKFVNKYQCGLTVDPNNSKEINEALDYLKAHPEEVIAMGERGRKAVADNLNWEREEEKLVSWYAKLLRGKNEGE
ncbi:glycosyltransferase [Salipaludibacillus agaradhaerens]|jgi:glycosyltransferase involved in cell wall biosynthesis|uniref:Glycosyltransferase n=1 Tax=Salipaludibacillus agaradhaerens TaxID=76935 RepID=A0A9Q4AYT7_SALAG|nr:glycosyltransferase [Salipaludibacillus agaradhaerens]MCR6094930.1 glycosyltransferase [Salipaludibacillus agaradhaerens]MCR6115512.1 glycosyltransferase [Salipaludibacillus agaradhaerens]